MPPMITRLALARWISIAGHPFSFTALLVVVAGSKRYGVGEAMRPDRPHVDRVDHTALNFHVAKMAVGTLANSRCFRPRRSPRLLRRRTSVARTTHELLCRGGRLEFHAARFRRGGRLVGARGCFESLDQAFESRRVRDVHRNPAESSCAGLGPGSSGAGPFRCMVAAGALAAYIARSARRNGSRSPCRRRCRLGLAAWDSAKS